MELFDEDLTNKNNAKNKKIANIILVFIILTILAIIAVTILLFTIKEKTLTVYVDGVANENLKSVLFFEDDNTKIYVPIKKIATYLQYNSYNGDYMQPSEDESKCYVQSQVDGEVAGFYLNSNTIYKIIPNSNFGYEYFQIDEPVKTINGELCTTVDGIQKAFNVIFNTVAQKDDTSINIYSMNYLANSYQEVVENIGYTNVDKDFNNKKTILDGMLVVKKDEKYGVINSKTGDIILDAKYDKIKYMQQTSNFLVTINGKVGIISKDKETKVNILYDDIKLIDYDSNLYIIELDNRYGVIDINGNIKIYPENNKIGIDSSSFKNNDIQNGYILLDKLIPVQKDGLWGFFDKSGKKIVDFKYDSLGYTKASTQNNLLVIPEYDVIVVGKDGKYNLINLNGNEKFNVFVDAIYMNMESGKTKYYMTFNEKMLDISQYFEIKSE